MKILAALWNEATILWLRAELGRALELHDGPAVLTLRGALQAARERRPAGWAAWLERGKAVRP